MRAWIRKKPYTYKGKTEDRWVVGGQNNGRRLPEKMFKREDEAKAYARKLDMKMPDGVIGKRGSVTFEFACAEWLKKEERRADDKNRNRDLTKGSLYGKQGDARCHLLPFFGSVKLYEIEPRDIQRFVDEQAEKFAHWTARRRRNLVKQVLDFAVDSEWLGVNPMTGKRIRVPGEVAVREDVPEVVDVAQLLDVLLNKPRPRRVNVEAWHGMKVQTVLIGLMGFRPGEAGGLHWDCVDLPGWRITVKRGLSQHDGLAGPKNRQSVRTLDLDPITHRVLSEHAEWTTRRRRPLKGYVLTTRQNGHVMPTTMRCRHHRALHFAGLEDANAESNFSPHALRHFAGSLWLAQGMQLKDVSWRLGHKTTAITEKVYMHQLKHDERAKQIVARLHAAFPKIAPSAAQTTTVIAPEIVDLAPDPVPLLRPPPPPSPSLVAPVPRLKANGYTTRVANHGRRARSLEDAPQWLSEALDMVDQGCTVVEIAHTLRRGEATVTEWLRVAGIEHPGKHAARVREAKREAMFAEMIEQGWQARDIAYKCQCSLQTVKKWLAGNGKTTEKTPEPVENEGN